MDIFVCFHAGIIKKSKPVDPLNIDQDGKGSDPWIYIFEFSRINTGLNDIYNVFQEVGIHLLEFLIEVTIPATQGPKLHEDLKRRWIFFILIQKIVE